MSNDLAEPPDSFAAFSLLTWRGKPWNGEEEIEDYWGGLSMPGNMICCRKNTPNTNLASLSGCLHSLKAEGPNDFRASRVEPSTPAHLEPDRSSAVPSST